jgi:hypothetical protein
MSHKVGRRILINVLFSSLYSPHLSLMPYLEIFRRQRAATLAYVPHVLIFLVFAEQIIKRPRLVNWKNTGQGLYQQAAGRRDTKIIRNPHSTGVESKYSSCKKSSIYVNVINPTPQ